MRLAHSFALGLAVLISGCDSLFDSPGSTPPPTGEPVPTEPQPTQTLTVRAMRVYGVSESVSLNTLHLAEADTLRDVIVLNTDSDTEEGPCSTEPCMQVWAQHPVASKTTLRLSVPISVDGQEVPAGTDLFPRLSTTDQSFLLSPRTRFVAYALFSVSLKPDRFVVPAGPVTVSMTWGTAEGASFADETRFIFVPAP